MLVVSTNAFGRLLEILTNPFIHPMCNFAPGGVRDRDTLGPPPLKSFGVIPYSDISPLAY
jgi:hypothetical protein